MTLQNEFIYTKDNGCYKRTEQRGFGTYYSKSPDPRGEDIKPWEHFQFSEGFTRIPRDLYSAIQRLLLHMTKSFEVTKGQSSELEVSVILLRSKDLTKWKAVVPKQVVSKGSVELTTDSIVDIITGEESNIFPPRGWYAGSSIHGHNTMPAFYSGTDDASDRDSPGLHLVTGNLTSLEAAKTVASVMCKDKVRRMVPVDSVVDTTLTEQTFHPNVLKQITVHKMEAQPQYNSKNLLTKVATKTDKYGVVTPYLTTVNRIKEPRPTQAMTLLLNLAESIQAEARLGNLQDAAILRDEAVSLLDSLDLIVGYCDDFGSLNGVDLDAYNDPFYYKD